MTVPDDFYAAPRLPTTFERAVLPIDKPKGLSSFDVIRRLRRIIEVKKIGHAGTLDPMATGLLICLVGRATKQMEAYMGQDKAYTATMRLGETTASYDAESEVTERRDASHVTDADLARAVDPFRGAITQLPPMYSAVKVGGERLYKKARRGETVQRPPREVTIHELKITGRRGDDVDLRIVCSKGTYIRSLAHDIGEALGVGAHLIALRRTRIGPHPVEDAWTLEALAAAVEAARSADAPLDQSAGS